MAIGWTDRFFYAAAGLGASLVTMLVILVLDDDSIMLGALVAIAYLMLATALQPIVSMLGFIGKVLFWTIIATAVISVIGHLTRPLPSPWNALWGMELYLLAVTCVVALICAIVAFIVSARPAWAVFLLALTPLFAYAGLVGYGPWPHAALIPVGALVALLVMVWWEPQRVHRVESAD